MKVLFITDEYTIDPLGIGYLSSYAKSSGHDIDLIQYKKEDLLFKVRDYDPDILAYSITTGKHTLYKQVDKELKESLSFKPQTVYGGAHVTFFPKFIKGDDIGIRGEAFEAFPELLNRLENKEPIFTMRNLALEGLINPLRILYDKSQLKRPDRKLMYKYRENYDNPIKNVMCSHYCPAQCPYCYNIQYKQMYNLRGADIRPVDSVIEEIRELKEYPLELIFMQDDIFPIYKDEWLEEFCKQYDSIKVPFHIQVRVEMINEERIRRLKEVGLHGVTFAIESGNPELRKGVLRRSMSDETILKASELLHKYNIRLRTENMIGIPNETMETAMETVKLNIKCKPDIGWASLFQPYPGTELHDKCLADGLFDDADMDTLSNSFFDTYRIKSKDADKFVRLQKLFSLFVAYPKLLPLSKILIRLPLDKLYKWVYKNVKVYLYQRRLYKWSG